MIKLYWVYKTLQNIKNNNVIEVKKIVEEQQIEKSWLFNLFNILQILLNYSYSYSYDCFEYLLLKIQEEEKDFFPKSYHSLSLSQQLNPLELIKIFHYEDKRVENTALLGTFSKHNEIGLKTLIILKLIKAKKVSLIPELIKDLNEEDKDSIFRTYFHSLQMKKAYELNNMLNIFKIDKNFFEKHILSNYGNTLDLLQYQFIKKNYEIDKIFWIDYFLIASDDEIIEDIANSYDLSPKIIFQKIHLSLKSDYQYNNQKSILNKIKLYQKLDFLTEENIIQSHKGNNYQIYIDYRYIPLLNISKATQSLLLKNNLKLIIFYIYHYYNMIMRNDEIFNVLDDYFNYIEKEKIIIEDDFIKEIIEESIPISEKFGAYFYKKFPSLFLEKSFSIFDKLMSSSTHRTTSLLQEVIQEKDDYRKGIFLNSIIRSISNRYYYHKDNNLVYFLIKDNLNKELKEALMRKKIQEKEALPIFIDMLGEPEFQNQETYNKVFLDSIGIQVDNAIYFLNNYFIDKEILEKAYMSLSYYNFEDNSHELAHNILSKNIANKKIELTDNDIEILKTNNIEMYKLYYSYTLNHKLNDNLKVKGIKTKKIKI